MTITATQHVNVVPKLRSVLNNDADITNLALRFRALFSLKHLATQGDESAIAAIAAAFSSTSALLKHELAYCLGQTKQRAAAPYLRAVLDDENEDSMVRHEAGEALGALGDVESLDLLRKYVGHPEAVIAQTCEIAVARIEWEASSASKTEILQKSAFASIDPAPPTPLKTITAGDVNIDSLRQELNNQSLPMFQRYRAMFRLRDCATHEAIDALASALDDPSALLRHEVSPPPDFNPRTHEP
jgi:deoxyhypusine monooxygenase